MLIPDLLMDVLLFGALLLGAVLDGFVPILHGAASLVAIGAATYFAAQEAAETLERRHWWTQESLWTSLSLCAAGFIYYWWRNQSDLALLVLSIGLMMASLMAAIAVISAIGTALRGNANAIAGLLFAILGATLLGVLAGALILTLGQPASVMPLAWKIGVVALSALAWKWRESVRPPTANHSPLDALSAPEAAAPTAGAPSPIEVPKFVHQISGVKSNAAAATPAKRHSGIHRSLIPQRGTVLDRFWPALVLGALLLLFAANASRLVAPISTPAVAGTPTPPVR